METKRAICRSCGHSFEVPAWEPAVVCRERACVEWLRAYAEAIAEEIEAPDEVSRVLARSRYRGLRERGVEVVESASLVDARPEPEQMALDDAGSREGRDEGMARSYNASPDAWKLAARAAVERVIERGAPFISDAVWATGLPKPPNSATALGNIMREFARAGRIVKTGRVIPTNQKASHKSPLTEWRPT